MPVHKDMLLFGAGRYAAKPVQRIGRLAPQRQQALLPALTAQTHLPRWNQLEIGPLDARDLADAGAAVVKEQQQRVVAPSIGGTLVRFGDDRTHVVGFEIGRGLLACLLRWDREHPAILQRVGQIVADEMPEEAAEGSAPAIASGG
jgi:hypothetical protein